MDRIPLTDQMEGPQIQDNNEDREIWGQSSHDQAGCDGRIEDEGPRRADERPMCRSIKKKCSGDNDSQKQECDARREHRKQSLHIREDSLFQRRRQSPKEGWEAILLGGRFIRLNWRILSPLISRRGKRSVYLEDSSIRASIFRENFRSPRKG